MRITWPNKYPTEVITSGIDWSLRLGEGETLDTQSFELITGVVTLSNDGKVGNVSFTQISDGIEGIIEVLCTVTTSAGHTLEEVAQFRVLTAE